MNESVFDWVLVVDTVSIKRFFKEFLNSVLVVLGEVVGWNVIVFLKEAFRFFRNIKGYSDFLA